MGSTYYESVTTRNTSLQREYESNKSTDETVLILVHFGDNQPSLVHFLKDSGYGLQLVDTLNDVLYQLAQDEHELRIVIVHEQAIEAAGDEIFTRLHEASSTPIRIIMLADKETLVEGNVDGPDAVIAWPWREQEVLAHVHSQLRMQKTISELIDSRVVLLGTSLLAMDMLGSTRNELSTQTALHQELLQRVHTHIGALRDYLELEVRRLPLGIARDSMRGALYRLRNLSALYDTMAILGLEDPVDFCNLATRIGQGVKAMYSPRSKLPLSVEGELMLSSASASPLALIVNELVTNAYRHAFPGGRFGKITITCGKEDQIAWCRVEDNGVGMPELPHVRAGKVSGAILVQRLMRSALGGTCTWQSNSSGTVATAQFPTEAA